jgi:hypothetical protein
VPSSGVRESSTVTVKSSIAWNALRNASRFLDVHVPPSFGISRRRPTRPGGKSLRCSEMLPDGGCFAGVDLVVVFVLATAPPDFPYRIGVVGRDEQEARRRFAAAWDAWSELHELTERMGVNRDGAFEASG